MSKKVRFTANRISQFECPSDKQQSFIWDSTTQGLGLRKTTRGNPSYIFQSRFNGKSIRISIGSPNVWSIGDAQQKARELQRQIDQGQDPRQIRAKLQAEQQRDQNEKELKSLKDTVGKFIPNQSSISKHVNDLKKINLKLWDIEDGKRAAEKEKKFDDKFIELARNVYKLNDERAKIKLAINTVLGSNIKEVKSYE